MFQFFYEMLQELTDHYLLQGLSIITLKFLEKIDLINHVSMVLCFLEALCKTLYRRGAPFFAADRCLKSIQFL